jgi:putative salt-induced outer membrane protein
LFVGVGAGYHVFKEKPLTWSVEIAPGYRRSKIADSFLVGPPLITILGGTANDFALRGSSKFAYQFNENVNFTNDTDVIWTDTSTQTVNTAAVTAQLTERISGRVSFQVRHETDPPLGFVNTDTATRASIVYGF